MTPRAALALVLAAAIGVIGCGALDDAAPSPPSAPRCKTLEEHLAPLLTLVDQGQLRHVAAAIEGNVDEATQRAMLRLLLDVGAALPPGSVQKLPQLVAGSDLLALLPVVVAVLEPLPGDPLASPPRPPKIAEMTAFSAISRTCLSRELFELLAALLREPEVGPAVDTLLTDLAGRAPQIQALLGTVGLEGRAGFIALVRNALTAIARPGFDPGPLLDLLAGLRDPRATPGSLPALVGALHTILRLATHDAAGQPDPHKIAALSDFAACSLDIDPGVVVAGHGWDVLVDGPPLQVPPRTGGPSRTGELLQLSAYAMDVLAAREASRDALSQFLGVLLRPDIAVDGIPELVVLLESDVIDGTLALLRDLVEKPCLHEAAQ